MPEDEREPFLDLVPQAAIRMARLGHRLVRADRHRRDRGDEEADRVDQDGVSRAEHADEGSAEARTRDLSERLARAELAVRVDELLRLDEHRQVALVRHVEEHREHAGDDRDDEELREVEHAEGVGDRYRADDGQAPDVSPDEHRTPAPPIDPRARRQRDQEERELCAGGECADLERGRVERDDREQRERELGDRAAHLADRLARPEEDEVPVLEEGSLPDFGHPVWLPK